MIPGRWRFDRGPAATRERLRAALFGRVVVLSAMLGTATLLALSQGVDLPLRQLAMVIAISYVVSLASAVWLRNEDALGRFAVVQIVFDLSLVSAMVLLTGGLRSPNAVLYNLAILAGAIVLPGRGGVVAALGSALTYGFLMNTLYYELLPASFRYPGASNPGPGFAVVFQMAANLLAFFLIGGLADFLTRRLASTEHALQEAEEGVRHAEEVQDALLQTVESGLLIVEASGRIEAANETAAEVLGASTSMLATRRLDEVIPVLARPGGGRPLPDPGAEAIEVPWTTAEGKQKTLRVRCLPVADTWRAPVALLFVVQELAIPESPDDAEPSKTEAIPESRRRPPERSPATEISGIVAAGAPMRGVLALVERVAPTESTVLITGESGTGKELVARAIHLRSNRSTGPLVVVNCAAIPEGLVESELFGHVRGAFTGAVRNRAGQFQTAHGGTIFLDEIGELPLQLQTKLLRVLQERIVTPVGGSTPVAVDVRVIAATNQDLEAAVDHGDFREDLFYRLNVIRIPLPPLRQRPEDLPLLVDHFVAKFAGSLGRDVSGVSDEAMALLARYPFPGNVRELENVIERGVILATGSEIAIGDLPESVQSETAGRQRAGRGASAPEPGVDISSQPADSGLDEELARIEKRWIQDALDAAGGVRKRAARILGINYRSLRHRLRKYGFDDAGRGELRDE